MIRLRWLAAIGLCSLALYAGPAYACRYNVREVGFVDVGIEPYWLFVYVPEGLSAEETTGLRDMLDAALIDTNIRCEPVAPDADPNHPATQFRPSGDGAVLPAAVLVSPDGQWTPVPLPKDAGTLTEVACSGVERLLHSPARQRILETAARQYAVVLLLEGPQPERNEAAKEAISAAIDHIAQQMEFLPKPIANPPEMVVVDQKSLASEGVLLWSLGLTPADINEPHAAILYGRGRWIGPMFKRDVLTPEFLVQILSIVGADCECGLDHRWLQGTMVPARWDAALQQKAAENLGFDPENPMIKMEMVSIVRRGMGGFAGPSMPLAYREMEVGGDSLPDAQRPSGPGREPNEASSVGAAHASPPVAASLPVSVQGEDGGSLSILAVTFGGMIVLVALGSLIIVLRARRT